MTNRIEQAVSAGFEVVSRPIAGLAEPGCSASSRSRTVWAFSWIVGGCALIALGASVRVYLPGTGVPMTLQSLALLLLGLSGPLVPAVAATLLYVALGAAGLPFFAGPGGLFGETGGYLLSFAPAVWIMGRMRGGCSASYARLLVAGLAGMSLVFIVGPAWLVLVYNSDFALAFSAGVAPFLVKAALEVPLAAGIARQARSRGMGR